MAWPQVPDHAKGQQKHAGGNRGQDDQRNINGAMQALPLAAVFAGSEVLFVAGAHLRRDAGNIVAPAGQNLAYDRINAFTHSLLQPDGFHRL